AIARGAQRLELSVAVRAAGDVRRRAARPRGSGGHYLAEWPHRRIQEPGNRTGIPVRGGAGTRLVSAVQNARIDGLDTMVLVLSRRSHEMDNNLHPSGGNRGR